MHDDIRPARFHFRPTTTSAHVTLLLKITLIFARASGTSYQDDIFCADAARRQAEAASRQVTLVPRARAFLQGDGRCHATLASPPRGRDDFSFWQNR